MSIKQQSCVEAMKQALEALKWINDEQAIISYEAVTALRQAIARAEHLEAEKHKEKNT